MTEEAQKEVQEAPGELTVAYVCYQCNKESLLPPGPLPSGWVLPPSGYELLTLVYDEPLPPCTVLALCSGKCLGAFKETANERLQQRKYRSRS